MNFSIHLLSKTYKISKNYNKIHENLQVTYKIMKIYMYLHMNTNRIPLISTETYK